MKVFKANKEDVSMQKVVITVVGKDKVGIMARVCTYLADNGINILDISQTIVSGYFNMMMIADMGEKIKDFEKVKSELDEMGTSIGVQIRLQREEIFDMMHRI
jgi:ACT domain-containing protein